MAKRKSMKGHQPAHSKSVEWLTPPEIIHALGQFDLDPCAPSFRPWPTAENHYTAEDDGLTAPWRGRVWLNPPFSRGSKEKWLKRLERHGNGIALVPAGTETDAFYSNVWGKADAVCFLRGRPHFHYPNGKRAKANSGCAIALVAYGWENVGALVRSNLGVVVRPI